VPSREAGFRSCRRRNDSRVPGWAALALMVWAAQPVMAQSARDYFRQNCAGCHTIGGGRIVGPDLKNVTERRDRVWLTRFLPNPKALIDAGDPTAVALRQEARGVMMPTLPDMTPARVEELLDFLAAESKEPSSVRVVAKVDRPFTPEDVATGRGLFAGRQRLRGGGPPCISCHTIGGLRPLGGGRLGPDLTLVFERLQGRTPLSAWLGAPATATMQGVFATAPLQPDEILSLVAYFDEAARTGRPADPAEQLGFFLLGMGGAVIGLVLAGGVWRRRLRGVRRALVEGNDAGDRG
jgi:mono/diheme cytochrome c family protein